MLIQPQNTAFLLGSGFSIPFGLPSVKGLTDALLDINLPFSYHSMQRYFYGLHENALYIDDDDFVKFNSVLGWIAREFIEFVQNWIKTCETFPKGLSPNYEDIYDFIKQFHLNISEEYENPALDSSFQSHARKFADEHRVDYSRLLECSLIYIDSIIQYKMGFNQTRLSENTWIIDELLSMAKGQEEIDIFSLNHDLVMETYCENKGIVYDDGFYADSLGLKRFDAARLYHTNAKMRIVKLHGSVDRYNHDGTLIRTNDPTNIPDSASSGFSNNFTPNVVTGKITKMLGYSAALQADIHSYFRMKLATTVSRLIVVGYGFADKGINNAIAAWYGSSDKQLTVITMNKDELLQGARGAMKRIIEQNGNGSVNVLEGGVKSVCLSMVKHRWSKVPGLRISWVRT